MPDEVMRIRTWLDAETMAVSVLRAWGHPDAKVTTSGADGGVDVRGRHVLAQVKHRSAPTGRPDVQRLFGARGHGTEDLYFFSRSGYSPQAIDYAEVHDIGLFSYTEEGALTAHTRTADALLPRAEVGDVKVAPSHATDGQTPDDATGCLWVLFGLLPLLGVIALIWWLNEGREDGAGGLFAMFGGLCLFAFIVWIWTSDSSKSK